MPPDGNSTAFFLPLLLLGVAYAVVYVVSGVLGSRGDEGGRERALDIAFGVGVLAALYTLILMIVALITLPDLVADLVRIVLVVVAFFGVLLSLLFGLFELIIGYRGKRAPAAGD